VQLVPVVGAVHLTDQLEAARSRLISVREEERRRLRADLHDELGATLAGLTLKAGLAANLVEHDRGEAQRLLREIETSLQTAVVHVRQVVEGLRPAQLDELGLDAAIREQVERLVRAGSPMALRVHGHAEPGLPAAIELAAYRIAQEALTNSVRHSRGSHVDIELAVEQLDQVLSVKVTDDGVGLSDAATLGYGIQSMRQRARELGGDCSIQQSSTGGVVVTAVLPLPAAGAA
jgi:signal transduction histidine kinase